MKPFGCKRFEQIIAGVFFKSADGKLIVSRLKDDLKRTLLELLQNFQAIQTRHLNIQKNDFRLE